MAPPLDAVLPERVELETVRMTLPKPLPFWMAPPLLDAVLPERVELEMVTVPF